jgi:hypothetical protein
MRWARHVARKEERCIQGFWWGNLRERNHLKDPGVDGKIILRCIFRKRNGSMDWIDLAQDRDRRRELVHAIMSFRVL